VGVEVESKRDGKKGDGKRRSTGSNEGVLDISAKRAK
jgi:hypothetical protein